MVDVSPDQFQSGAAPLTDTGTVQAPKGAGKFVSPDEFTNSPSLDKATQPAGDSLPGGEDASTAFMHHFIANLPGGEDLAAALEAPFTGRSVTEQKHDIQARGARQWEDHPWASGAGVGASLIGQVAALPVAGPEEAAAGVISRFAPALADYAPALARTGVGAGYGAVYGGTSGPDLWDTQGALIGAGMGGAGAAVAPVLTKAASGVARWAGFGDPAQEAARKVVGAFEADQPPAGPWGRPAPGTSGAIDATDFAKAKAAGQPAMAADLGGENVRELADVAASGSPDARKILRTPAEERFTSQQSRFSDYLDRSFGQDLNTATQKDEIAQAARQANSSAYRAAYNHPNAQAVWNDNLANLMRDPNVQAAIPNAQRKAASAAVDEQARTGRPTPIPQNPFVRDADGYWDLRRDAQGNATIPSLQWWDQVNRSLGDQVTSARGAGNWNDARVIGGIQDHLQSALDQQVPQFAQARATAAGFFNEGKLVDSAIKYDKTSDENTINTMIKDLQGRPAADREVFARAYAAQLKQRFSNPAESADLVKVFQKQRTKMEAALNTPSDPTRAQGIEAWWLREQGFNAIKNAFGNSKTAQRLAAQAKHGQGHGLVSQVAQSFTAPGAGAIGGAYAGWEATPHEATWGQTFRNVGLGAAGGAFAGWLAQRRGRVDAATWNEVARQLASSDPKVYENAVKRVKARPLYMDALRRAITVLPGMAAETRGPFNNQ